MHDLHEIAHERGMTNDDQCIEVGMIANLKVSSDISKGETHVVHRFHDTQGKEFVSNSEFSSRDTTIHE
jgi:hypothetical protein